LKETIWPLRKKFPEPFERGGRSPFKRFEVSDQLEVSSNHRAYQLYKRWHETINRSKKDENGRFEKKIFRPIAAGRTRWRRSRVPFGHQGRLPFACRRSLYLFASLYASNMFHIHTMK